MVGIVIVAHGSLATGLVDAAAMIVGQQDQLEALELREGQSPDSLEEEVAATLEAVDTGEGVLVMADLFGATPFNVSARQAAKRETVEVVTGFSLAMLLETVMQREGATLAELTSIALEAGQSGIRSLSEELAR